LLYATAVDVIHSEAASALTVAVESGIYRLVIVAAVMLVLFATSLAAIARMLQSKLRPFLDAIDDLSEPHLRRLRKHYDDLGKSSDSQATSDKPVADVDPGHAFGNGSEHRRNVAESTKLIWSSAAAIAAILLLISG
jgi:Sec-independent protein translocase protein TatA